MLCKLSNTKTETKSYIDGSIFIFLNLSLYMFHFISLNILFYFNKTVSYEDNAANLSTESHTHGPKFPLVYPSLPYKYCYFLCWETLQ